MKVIKLKKQGIISVLGFFFCGSAFAGVSCKSVDARLKDGSNWIGVQVKPTSSLGKASYHWFRNEANRQQGLKDCIQLAQSRSCKAYESVSDNMIEPALSRTETFFEYSPRVGAGLIDSITEITFGFRTVEECESQLAKRIAKSLYLNEPVSITPFTVYQHH